MNLLEEQKRVMVFIHVGIKTVGESKVSAMEESDLPSYPWLCQCQNVSCKSAGEFEVPKMKLKLSQCLCCKKQNVSCLSVFPCPKPLGKK